MDESVAAQLDALIAQVGAFQAQIVALRVGIEAYVGQPERPQMPCLHVNTEPAPGSTLGHKRMKCVDCRAFIEP